MVRKFALLLICNLAPPACAQPPGSLVPSVQASERTQVPAQTGNATADIAAAIHDNRWADADAAAATLPDPVARKLVLFYRLLSPGGGHPAEIAAFMAENPDWPSQGLMSHRLQEAIAAEGDDGTVLEICAHQPLRETPSMLRCADADNRTGHAPDAAEIARQAWITGITDPAAENAFIHAWGRVLTFADQWRRFDRLAWTDNGAVGGTAWRQIARLDPLQRPAAEARLALKRDDPSARALVATLPAGAQLDPALILELARWLRRGNQDEDAQKLWLAFGPTAERSVAPEHRAAFWDERNQLARRRLRAGDAAGAYAIVDQAETSGEQTGDAQFLAGFIALRRLGDTDAAQRHFRTLVGLSKAAITQGRAFYWLGRTAQARHDAVAAHEAFTAAAAWPTTYYGQLAARQLGEDDEQLAARIRNARDPDWDPAHALVFAGRENARAAALLFLWGEPRRARTFILRLDELAESGSDRALSARIATSYGLPDIAVAIARRAGRDGWMLPNSGWPAPFDPPPPVEPALTLGLMRQESNFDPGAASPVGARGLMQLMPGTAQAVARQLGDPAAAARLLDPAANMRLGTAYLGGLLDQFGGVMPYAVAGYNAGPGRVAEWLATNGDPNGGVLDMIDWIELIPFSETRNYVQRVIENVVIYRAHSGTVLPHPLAHFLG
jgi:soluble lytic murein transglycosylase